MMNSIKKKIKYTRRLAKSLLLYRFLWGEKFSYKHDPKVIDVGWSVVQTYGVFQCPIQYLRVVIDRTTGRRMLPIEETPHYQYIRTIIKGDGDHFAREKYKQYILRFVQDQDPEDKLSKTERLVNSIVFESGFDLSSAIVTYPPKLNRASGVYEVRIYDGTHRSSIAKVLGYESILCRLK